MIRVRGIVIATFFLFFLFFFSNKVFAQVCSGGGYDTAPAGVGTCQAGAIGSYCTYYSGGSGIYFGCNTSAGYCSRLSYLAGMYNLCIQDTSLSCHNETYNYYASGYTTDGCYYDYGTTSDGGYGDGGYGDGGYGDSSYAPPPTNTPTRTPTPTPTPRPDLAVANFKLVGSDGKDKAIDPLHWSLPHFYTGEDVCPYVTLKNISNTDSVSSTGNTWTAFYSNGSSSTAPAYNTASDVDVYLKNGQFTGKYSKTYNAAGTNSSYYTYKTGSNGGAKCWPAAAGRNYAWVYMNYDHKASDLGYGNNVAQSQYWVDAPPTYTISGKVVWDKNKNGIDDGATENVPIAIGYTVTVKDGATVITSTTKSGNSSTSFSFNNLPGTPSHTYTVEISAVTSPYFATFPSGGSFSVTVGPGCAIVPSGGAGTCTAGNDVSGLTFGIDNTTSTDPTLYGISGKIWYDTNGDGVRQSTEPVMPAGFSASVSVTQGSTSYPTGFFSNGNPVLSNWDTNPDNLRAATYKITYTNPPAGYQFSVPSGGTYTLSVDGSVPLCTILPTSSGRTCTAGTSGTKQLTGLDFGLVPIPTPTITLTPTPIVGSLTVSGSVYVDANQNSTQDGGEVYNPPLSTPPSFTYIAVPDGSQPLATTANSSGTFTLNGLTDGQYTVKYAVPAGYSLTYPYTPNLSFTIVGGDCASAEYAQLGSSVTCDAPTGNLQNLKIGISAQSTWLQSLGGDVRFDAGFTNSIPAVVGVPTPYKDGTGHGYSLSVGTGAYPGVLFAGTSTPDVGLGLVSATNQQVSGSVYGQSFAPVNTSSLRTSYQYVLTSLKQSNVQPTQISTLSGCSDTTNCTLTNISSGVYQATGTLDIKNFSIAANSSVIILVNGFIFVSNTIDVPTTSSIAFISSSDIYVRGNVGTIVPPGSYPPSGNMEGYYSADRDLVIFGNNDCSIGQDKMLSVEGGIVVNAALKGGSLKLYRKLCTNSSYPALTLKERPDMLLNLSSYLKAPTYTWREVAP
jgi:hypothetical protein